VKLCDIDHVLMPKRINGRKPLVNRAHIQIVNQSVLEYTDHFGKRTTIDIDWDQLLRDDEGLGGKRSTSGSGAGAMELDDGEDEDMGHGKERIRDHVAHHGEEVVIPIE
jgi:hypothetical protein